MPRVSVIVPNYNYAQYLNQRIDSILNQTFSDIEIILLDDASSDNSSDILNNYKNHPLVTHLIINEINSGSPFLQWEKGITLAQGEFIWIAESDDYADPFFLETVVNCIDKNNAALCFVGSILVNEKNEFLQEDWDKWTKGRTELNYSVFDSSEYIIHNLYWNSCIYNASSVIFRKEYFESVDKSYLDMKYCGDWLFWVEVARCGPIVEVYKKMNFFRQHSQRTTFKSFVSGQNIFEDMMVVNHIESFLNVSWYKKCLRRGIFLKKIDRLNFEINSDRHNLTCCYKKLFGNNKYPYYVERFNKILSIIFPWILTPERDRL